MIQVRNFFSMFFEDEKSSETFLDQREYTGSESSKKGSLFDKCSEELSSNWSVKSEIESGKRVGFYRMIKSIGNGNFSEVKLATHIITREKVAVKIINKIKLSSKTQRLLSQEISSMERLQHPHIIRLYEVMETMTNMYMVMEYAPSGELHTAVTTKGKFTEPTARIIFAQIVSAVDHMHSKQVIHRDIKAENIFIASNQMIKIGDFGFSASARPDQCLNTFCGSPPYAAPELFKDDYYYGGLVDIWALGVLLYFILTGVTPFRADTVGRLKYNILSGQFIIPSFISRPCQLVITMLLQRIPSQRWTLKEVMKSEWMEDVDFPQPLRPFDINPQANLSYQSSLEESKFDVSQQSRSSQSEHGSLSLDEVEAYRQLQRLGITYDHVRRSTGQSSRSSVTGIYRIVLHQMQKSHSRLDSPLMETESDHGASSNTNNKNSTFCEIL